MLEECNFKLLADGSLECNAAKFRSSKVKFDDDVYYGDSLLRDAIRNQVGSNQKTVIRIGDIILSFYEINGASTTMASYEGINITDRAHISNEDFDGYVFSVNGQPLYRTDNGRATGWNVSSSSLSMCEIYFKHLNDIGNGARVYFGDKTNDFSFEHGSNKLVVTTNYASPLAICVNFHFYSSDRDVCL